MNATQKSQLRATIRVVRVGQNFGWEGQVWLGRKRMATTDCYGSDSAAHIAAEDKAEKLGLNV
jgi:hypothetical protein